ncbi:MAG: methylmalonyl Co-A mutase-associated GTPase MeaB [Bacteroidota bacterium]
MSKKPDVFQSALKVQEGIAQPSQINPDFNYKRVKKKLLSVNEFIDGILSGNRVILSQAITLVESSLPQHYAFSQEIIAACLPHAGNSIRIGITGVPGVGKSTFIEAFGKLLTQQGHKLAVLAIDPSSERSKGSILGDKTRMEELAIDDNAFIRPSPTAGSLGGVARKTRESIILCEAAGFDRIIVETVGVGQSEIAVHSMVDFFLLLMLSGAGDELQGIKRGIMEMADAILINKADGDNIQKANLAKAQYSSALNLFPPTASKWKPIALTCSSYTKQGVDDVLNVVYDFVNLTSKNGYFNNHRKEQSKYTLYEYVHKGILDSFYSNNELINQIPQIEEQVVHGSKSPYVAGAELIAIFNKHQNK